MALSSDARRICLSIPRPARQIHEKSIKNRLEFAGLCRRAQPLDTVEKSPYSLPNSLRPGFEGPRVRDGMHLLQGERIVKSFGGVRALNGVDFHVAEGEIVGLIVPNR